MSARFDLQGRVAIVTGAGQGLGRAYAKALADAGAIAVIAELDGERAEDTAAEIRAGGGQAFAIQTDVSDADSVERAARTALDRFHRIDILVNNAAVFSTLGRASFDAIPLAEWEHVMRVNVTGSFLCARAVAPAMRAAQWGRIINVSSSTVPLGLPMFTHYVTSKAAIIGMTRAMARELGPHGITVNALLPGLTDTEVDITARSDTMRAKVIDMQCIKRIEAPDDLVGTVLFLASPASAFLTGQSLLVDGGSAHL